MLTSTEKQPFAAHAINLSDLSTQSDLFSLLRWSLLKPQKIRVIDSYIHTVLQPLAQQKWVSLADLMWWNSDLSSLPPGETSLHFATAVRKESICPTFSMGHDIVKFFQTGADYTHVDFKGSYKCYFSFDLSTEAKKQKAKEFAVEVVRACKDKKITLWAKMEDHNYDSILYTWDIKQLKQIIQSLYPTYISYWIFRSVYHFLQQPIPWVDAGHFGVVQEPRGGVNGSHSWRMFSLWKYLEEGKSYEEACLLIWVKPEAPREIDWTSEWWKQYIRMYWN